MSLAMTGFLLAAAVLGGSLNAIVGGGSFVAFPALVLAGVAPISANATTALALWPASIAGTVAYRRDLRFPPRLLFPYSIASLVGGGVGALLLLRTPSTTFVRLIPWLLFFASAIFTFGGRFVRPVPSTDGNHRTHLIVGVLLQALISIYGGYFGGGMGIMMLAAWSLLGMTDLHAMTGLRTLLGTMINGVALIAFASAHALDWRRGLLMMAGATIGGYGSAVLARRLDPKALRPLVIGIAWFMTAFFFARQVGFV